MKDYQLKNVDPDDVDDLLRKVEKSFDIDFGTNELAHITTFGELSDHIVNKIELDHTDDCTTQQAFYKIRNGISSIHEVDHKTISVDSSLVDLIPRQNRRSIVKRLEKQLGFKLNILKPPDWVTGTLGVLLLASLIMLFFNWRIGLSGLAFSIVGSMIANKTGKQFNVKTVGEAAKKMTREHYIKSRRSPKTYNRNEIEAVLHDWFCECFYLEKSELTRDAKFS